MEERGLLRSMRRETISLPLASQIIDSALLFLESKQDKKQLQKSPYIENIDLLEEEIVIRNPSSSPRNLTGWEISDDRGCNKFQFPNQTLIEPTGSLTIYCSAKVRHSNSLKNPYIFWKNKDGTNRMKNVLNDGIAT